MLTWLDTQKYIIITNQINLQWLRNIVVSKNLKKFYLQMKSELKERSVLADTLNVLMIFLQRVKLILSSLKVSPMQLNLLSNLQSLSNIALLDFTKSTKFHTSQFWMNMNPLRKVLITLSLLVL